MQNQTPKPGDTLVINFFFTEINENLTSLLNLKVGEPLKVIAVEELDDITGVTIVEREDGTIIDVSQIPELSEYWCLFLPSDFVRLIPEQL